MSTPHPNQDDIDISRAPDPLKTIRKKDRKLDDKLAELVSVEDTLKTERRRKFLME